MRKKLLVVLGLSAVLALGVAGVAYATQITLRAGNLIATFGGTTSPKALPKTTYTPVTTNDLRQDQDQRRHPAVGLPRSAASTSTRT